MKKDIHPSNYREVVFKDMSNGETFITRSTAARKTRNHEFFSPFLHW